MFSLTPVLDTLFRTSTPFSRLDATPAMDVYRRDDEVIAHIDLPGVELQDISLEVVDGWVSISAERSYSPEPGDTVYLSERTFGRLERRFRLGSRLDASSVKAELVNGVLTLRVRALSETSPTKIAITSPAATKDTQ